MPLKTKNSIGPSSGKQRQIIWSGDMHSCSTDLHSSFTLLACSWYVGESSFGKSELMSSLSLASSLG